MSTDEKNSEKHAMCSCVFEKMEDKYTKDQLLEMKNGIIPKDFSSFAAQATLSCIAEK
ncbi:hypothetical protein QU481_14415 [Crenobacter sp. SG2303]|uniref:Uncharacterized protein n=1 Tax=Crenobacter oryzisoli TaxID=3056844 RepID=A0ABT7XQM3_9NEIS|nr:hypothetical protein [Crenobacter sp. SG2303]MDN0076080.1 hypothetical protein [Crenobacter sp. SG2303]